MKALFIYHKSNKRMEKFYNHLVNNPDFCRICEDCYNCRGNFSYKEDLERVIIEDVNIEFIDEPEEYIPDIPKGDVCVAQLHEDLLYELPYYLKDKGYKALIVPSESPEDLSLGMRRELKKICDKLNIEFANPKPFCSLEKKEEYNYINKFIDYFKIGKPKLNILVEDNKIKDIKVLISSPCGETYYIAKRLKGLELDIEKVKEEIANAHHNYPCLASMKIDKELGDTILHKAGYIAYDSVLKEIKK
ncbi:DUF166 domain-containing protein [Methanocaldococcus indicus]|uniref:DUF166 domain-containing protein n=1 Tax=Methanocaldococcus indicus TaxID=213231 RepID=UPI003C6D8458